MNSVVAASHAIDVIDRFIKVIDQTPTVAIQSFDWDGVIHLWNGASAALYEISANEAIGKRIQDILFHTVEKDELSHLIKDIWDSGHAAMPRDWQVVTFNGKSVWVYSTMFPIVQGGKTSQIFCMDVDITERKLEEQALFNSETNFRTMFERTSDAIFLAKDGRFIDVNPAGLKMFGYADKADMIGLTVPDISPPLQPDGKPSSEKIQQVFASALENGNTRVEWLHKKRDGQIFWAEKVLTMIPGNGSPYHYAVTRDISERKSAEQKLRLAAQVIDTSREGIMIADHSRKIISVNKAATDITGYTAEEIMNAEPPMFFSAISNQEFYGEICENIHANDHWEGELVDRRRNGEAYPLRLSITVVRDFNRNITNYFSIFSDITERKRQESHIRYQAEHDFLTGLPTRSLLIDRLVHALANAKRNEAQLALLFIDLDRFKSINDSLGHAIGDKLLREVAARLNKNVRSVDTVCRQGGDEFVILLANVKNLPQVAHVADSIMKAISTCYQIDGNQLDVTASIGISMYPGDGTDIETLQKNADIAMYHAKASGRNSYQFFSDDMNARVAARLRFETSLGNAVHKQEFILQYQPKIDMISGRTIGAEALIRWQHPESGLLLPGDFMSIAEDCGLMGPISDWVLRSACLQAKSWLDQQRKMVVSVNLSVAQLRQADMLKSIADALQFADLEPQYLELEFNQSILADETETTLKTLNALSDMGVKLTLDNFGIGYCSLSYLKNFPIKKLKIDQSFVHDITSAKNNIPIITAIIAMAKSLNLIVIAEGVETSEQLKFLESHGCDQYQGYYSSKALSPKDVVEFMTSH